MTFDEAFESLLRHEGGFSDHPADPGGATRFGVTQAVARSEGYRGDMREYPLSDAKRVYRKRYWTALRLDEVPAGMRFDLFDSAVNSGPAQTLKWAQRIVMVPDDGKIGPATLAALNSANVNKFVAKFNGVRLHFLASLPGWTTFGRGWARRVAENLMR
jgi:lysozyme family protein